MEGTEEEGDMLLELIIYAIVTIFFWSEAHSSTSNPRHAYCTVSLVFVMSCVESLKQKSKVVVSVQPPYVNSNRHTFVQICRKSLGNVLILIQQEGHSSRTTLKSIDAVAECFTIFRYSDRPCVDTNLVLQAIDTAQVNTEWGSGINVIDVEGAVNSNADLVAHLKTEAIRRLSEVPGLLGQRAPRTSDHRAKRNIVVLPNQ